MPPNTEKKNHTKESNIPPEKQKEFLLGAKILTQSNFEGRQKEIVDSSFNKARQQGEKLPGKNNERRNYAY